MLSAENSINNFSFVKVFFDHKNGLIEKNKIKCVMLSSKKSFL
jgi:hypothetical protein